MNHHNDKAVIMAYGRNQCFTQYFIKLVDYNMFENSKICHNVNSDCSRTQRGAGRQQIGTRSIGGMELLAGLLSHSGWYFCRNWQWRIEGQGGMKKMSLMECHPILLLENHYNTFYIFLLNACRNILMFKQKSKYFNVTIKEKKTIKNKENSKKHFTIITIYNKIEQLTLLLQTSIQKHHTEINKII
ncbi:hypothetical protein ACF0H5_011034 [Mactra antiquata]